MGRVLMTRAALAALALLLLAAPAISEESILEKIEKEVIALSEKLAPSVVRVHATGPDGFGGTKKITVSGVVLDDAATIATLGSAVSSATKVEIQTADGPRRPAKVLGVDERFNVGILEADPAGLVPVEMAPPHSVKVGAFAISIGNPFGLTDSVSTGIVSGLGRQVQGYTVVAGRKTTVVYYDLIQTTVLVNPGDSGGLVADSKGRMIGMISSSFGRSPSVERIREMIHDVARRIDLDQVQFFVDALKLTEDQKKIAELVMGRLRGYQKRLREVEPKDPIREGMTGGAPGAKLGAHGINFALPTDQVLFTARMVRAHGRVVKVGLTVGVPDPAVAAQTDLEEGEGLDVLTVRTDSPAGRAGLKVHDILTSFGGHPVGSTRGFRRALLLCPVKGPIEVLVLRGGVRTKLTLRFD
ncbi:MAG: trypsin-like peptidase domain-containing protein [Planctomycetota bacterium]